MSTHPNRQNKAQQGNPPRTSEQLAPEPLSAADSRRAEEDALQRPLMTSQEVIDDRVRGRVEVETKRVSEEVTHKAQERLRASQATSGPPSASAVSSPHANTESSASLASGAATIAQQTPVPIPVPIKRVVVPLDGTTYSERALPFVSPVAHMAGAEITLLHVVVEPAPPPFDAVTRSVNRLLSEAPAIPLSAPADYLAAILSRLAQQDIAAESMSISAPSSVEGVELVVERLGANLVILATHARYGVEQQLLGSVGDQLVRRGKTPVLLIPPRVDVPTYPLHTFSRVLVPVDGSMLAEQALAPVISLAQQATAPDNMHIVLFYVADNHISRRDGVRYIEGLRQRLFTQALPPSVEVTSAAVVGSPSGAIVGAAEFGIINLPDYPAPFDLVAMATHGRGGLQRWLYGSVTAYALPRIKTPVLLVHPHTPDLPEM
ncbi:MAG TPA: universal stress protein [Ktedonobacterales bacterium]